MSVSRRRFTARIGALAGAMALTDWSGLPLAVGAPSSGHSDLLALRRAMIDTPLRIGLHRARVFTTVFRENAAQPWIVRKGVALRE